MEFSKLFNNSESSKCLKQNPHIKEKDDDDSPRIIVNININTNTTPTNHSSEKSKSEEKTWSEFYRANSL
jgi:hypothetical protein